MLFLATVNLLLFQWEGLALIILLIPQTPLHGIWYQYLTSTTARLFAIQAVLFVAVGSGSIVYSTDGVNWSADDVTGLEYASWSDITYGNGIFVAVAQGKIAHSTDGKSWSVTDTNENNWWRSVTYGDGLFVVVAYDGENRILYSSDGISWGDNLTKLTLTNDKAFNSETGDEVTTIDQAFKAGDKVVGEGDATVFADSPAFSTTLYSNPTGTGEITIDTGLDNTVKSLVWFKNRDSSVANHKLYDTLRGPEQLLESNEVDGNQNNPNSLIEFLSNGVKVGSGSGLNSSENMVAWNFRAAPGFFDVVTYEGDGNPGLTVSHSLESTPGMMIVKGTETATNWAVYHKDTSETKFLVLNDTRVAQEMSSAWNDTAPTDTEFTLGDASFVNTSGKDFVAYLFADTPGLIKCGEYDGGKADNTIIPTGFDVAFVIIKSSTKSSTNWVMYDDVREVNNSELNLGMLKPNASDIEDTSASFVQLRDGDNGFKLVGTNSMTNRGGEKYIYIAVAKNAMAGDFFPTGTLTADADKDSKLMTLTDVTGEWKPGLTAVNETEVTETAPGADDIVFTSNKPVATSGTVNSWGSAEWELSVDSGFADKQTASVQLQDVDVEQGPTNFTLEGDTEYWVRTKYNSADPVVVSEWSDSTKFKTAGGSSGADGNFSTTIYTGNNGKQKLDTGVDNTSKSLVWIKWRGRTSGETDYDHVLVDTLRGRYNFLSSNESIQEKETTDPYPVIESYDSDGVTLGYYNESNNSALNYVCWNFAAAKGFFDVVTYDAGVTEVPHSLGVTPGVIIYKSTDTSGNWIVMHKEAAVGGNEWWQSIGVLNETNAWVPQNNYSTAAPDAEKFYPADYLNSVNFVAYLFADNPDGGIKCGMFTGGGDTSNPIEVDCGFKAGWVMWKRADGVASGTSYDWQIFDAKRGLSQPSPQNNPSLTANESAKEASNFRFYATDNGFAHTESLNDAGKTGNFIYVAIADTTVQFYDENTNSTVTNHTLTKRYGVDPLETDLRKFGIFPLTEQPTYSVDTYVKEGDAYNPVRDYTSEINAANAKVEALLERVQALEAEEEGGNGGGY